jgi:hypothetical protein
LLPKIRFPRREQSIFPRVPSNEMRRLRVTAVVFAAFPNFVKEVRIRGIGPAV